VSSLSIRIELAAQELNAGQAGFRGLLQPIAQIIRLVIERPYRQRSAIQDKVRHRGQGDKSGKQKTESRKQKAES
jgi:hypothetical protein